MLEGPVLMFFAHPDDETLAAGGTIHKLTCQGIEVWCVIPGTGVFARTDTTVDDLTKLRADCERALGVLGVPKNRIIFGDFPDNAMDAEPLLKLNRWLENAIANIGAKAIFTHHQRCTNIDHRYCFEAATVATRPAAHRRIPLICAEVPSSTGYLRPTQYEPNLYVELSPADLGAKKKALTCYASEVHAPPHPRSPEVIEAMARVRGSESGFHYAEAFMVMRTFA